MKKKWISLGVLGVCILCTACGHSVNANGVVSLTNKQTVEGDEKMGEQRIVSEDEKALLKKISVNEQRVEDGDLLKWQQEILNQYDYAMDYLKEKYPSYTFHIVDCEPKNTVNAYTTFNFTEDSDAEGYYDLYLEVENEKYTAKDNFYGAIIGPKYEAALKELLGQASITCESVEAHISIVEGEKFNEQMAISEVMSGQLQMENMTIFHISKSSLSGDDYEGLVKKIRDLISEKKIYGYYIVSICDGTNDGEEVYRANFDETN